MRYYVVLMRDDAMLGMRSGVRSQTLLTPDGFDTEALALEDLRIRDNPFTRGTNTYFRVVESETPPKDWEKSYSFSDYDLY